MPKPIALLLLGLVVALLAPSASSATTARLLTDCVSIARHGGGAEIGYEWGSLTLCQGGLVAVAKSKAAMRDTTYAGMPDYIKTQTCGHGFYAVKGRTVFAAKSRAAVKKFRTAYRHRYHQRFGPIRPLAAMPSYQPERWC